MSYIHCVHQNLKTPKYTNIVVVRVLVYMTTEMLTECYLEIEAVRILGDLWPEDCSLITNL